jgi:hypothetical protein
MHEAIDETVLELGIRYVGTTGPDNDRSAVFKIVDRSKTSQRDARSVAESAFLLLKTSPFEEVKKFADSLKAVYVE